jgi:hypothetical protein
MVSKDFEWLFCPYEIRMPVGNSFHYGQKFSVIDIVISFSFGESC